MEPIQPDQDITPERPAQPGPLRPTESLPRRVVVNDFSPRPARPYNIQPQPAPQPTQPQATPMPVASNPVVVQSPTPTPAPEQTSALHPYVATDISSIPDAQPEPPKQRSHAWLVGLVVFIGLSALLLAPLLPGKILQNFPGSSVSFATGEQTISCVGDMSPLQTTTSYDAKAGFPIVYNFRASSTIQAMCNGKNQTATSGQNSQFNPLGAVIDVVSALAVALLVATIWRKITSRRK